MFAVKAGVFVFSDAYALCVCVNGADSVSVIHTTALEITDHLNSQTDMCSPLTSVRQV